MEKVVIPRQVLGGRYPYKDDLHMFLYFFCMYVGHSSSSQAGEDEIDLVVLLLKRPCSAPLLSRLLAIVGRLGLVAAACVCL